MEKTVSAPIGNINYDSTLGLRTCLQLFRLLAIYNGRNFELYLIPSAVTLSAPEVYIYRLKSRYNINASRLGILKNFAGC